jgi:hypothetical protein
MYSFQKTPEQITKELNEYRLQSPAFKRIIVGCGLGGAAVFLTCVVIICCKNDEATILPT